MDRDPSDNMNKSMLDKMEKWRNLVLLVTAEVLIFGLWFSASAILPQMTEEWGLSGAGQSWMTMSVQIGFVFGALLIALLNLADRIPPNRLIAVCAFGGAAANAGIAFLDYAPALALLFRFVTGMGLAGSYPPGMKLAATWCKEDRGLGIGLLVGGIVLGKSIPHLLNALPLLGGDGMPPWRAVLLVTSALAALGALVVGIGVHAGPFLTGVAPFNWRFAGRVLSHKPTRLANFGYLGHMWELYGMWTWVPIFLIASYSSAGWSTLVSAPGRICGYRRRRFRQSGGRSFGRPFRTIAGDGNQSAPIRRMHTVCGDLLFQSRPFDGSLPRLGDHCRGRQRPVQRGCQRAYRPSLCGNGTHRSNHPWISVDHGLDPHHTPTG